MPDIESKGQKQIDISRINFSSGEYVYGRINQMADAKTTDGLNFDPVMIGKVASAEKNDLEQGIKRTPVTTPSELIKKLHPNNHGIRGLKDVTGEQVAVDTGRRAQVQRLSTELTELGVKKREGNDEEYKEYLSEVSPELKKLYRQVKGKVPLGYMEQVKYTAKSRGVNLDPSEKITESYQQAKAEIKPKSIIAALRKLGQSRLD